MLDPKLIRNEAEQVAEKLGERSKIHICEFEKVDDYKKFDLNVFF